MDYEKKLKAALDDASVHQVDNAYSIVFSNKENADVFYEACWRYFDCLK